jgi:HEAT repeat protein
MAAARNEKTLKANIEALRRGDKPAQVAAIHALGGLDDPRGIPALVGALASPDGDVRALAMGKLVFLNNKGLIPVLVKSLADKEPRVRQHALYALQRLKAKSAANRMAKLATSDPDEMVRFNAVLALGAVASGRHKAAFVLALKEQNNDIVLAALRGLAKVAPEEAGREVMQLVRNAKRWAKVPQVRRDVMLRLLESQVDKKEVRAFLRQVLEAGLQEGRKQGKVPTSMDLLEVARLLAEAGDAAGVPVLLENIKGGDYTHERAAHVFGKLKVKEAVPALLEYSLPNGFYTLKLKVVRSLGEIGDVRALPALAGFFNGRIDDFPVDASHVITKEDPDLRLTALAAIAKIAAQGLREAARSADGFESKRARELLAEFPKPR